MHAHKPTLPTIPEVKTDTDGDIELLGASLANLAIPEKNQSTTLKRSEASQSTLSFQNDLLTSLTNARAAYIVNKVFAKLAAIAPEPAARAKQAWARPLLDIAQQFISKCDKQDSIDQFIDKLVEAFKTRDIGQAIKDALKNTLKSYFLDSEVSCLLDYLVPSSDGLFTDAYESKESIEDELKPLLTDTFKKFDYSEFPMVRTQIIELLAQENLSAYEPWHETDRTRDDHPDLESCMQAGDRIQVKLELKRILADIGKKPLEAKVDFEYLHTQLFKSMPRAATYLPLLTLDYTNFMERYKEEGEKEDKKKDVENILKQLLNMIDSLCNQAGTKQVNIKYSKKLALNTVFMIALSAAKRVYGRSVISNEAKLHEPVFTETVYSKMRLS